MVIPPPGEGEGNWAGGANAMLHDGFVYLTYRLRRPVDQGRGTGVFVARSSDGVAFETVAHIGRGAMDAESLERAALTVTRDGRWRLYLSCATMHSKHWRIEMLEADSPERLDARTRRVVLPGSASLAVKDPVIYPGREGWEMWVICHPLDRGDDEADRMYSARATSADGIVWSELATVLTPRAGEWDSRGARLTSVLYAGSEPAVGYYDGRASAEENFEERTGVSSWDARKHRFIASNLGPIGTPYGGLRYLTEVQFPDGSRRLYFEGRRQDGAHELRTQFVPAPSISSGVRTV